jgi:hypothetical protein
MACKHNMAKASKALQPARATAWLKKVADGGRLRARRAGPQIAKAAAVSSGSVKRLARGSVEYGEEGVEVASTKTG